MKNDLNPRFCSLILFAFLFYLHVLTTPAQTGVPVGATRCFVEENGRKREVPCPSSNSNQNNNSTTPTPNNSEKEKAERERKEREAEERRQAEEAQKRKEAAERQKRFDKNKNDALQTIKGGTGETTIRGGSSGETGIREIGSDSGVRDATPVVTPTPIVSDKPPVPRAYEKAVNETFPNSTSDVTERIRKGFLAVETKDWKVAKAWFQDALNREPKNIGIARLVAFCDYNVTTAGSTKSVPTPQSVANAPISEETVIKNFLESLNDFYLNYVPKHPELRMSVTVQKAKKTPVKESSIETYLQDLKKFLSKPKFKHEKTVVIAVRG